MADPERQDGKVQAQIENQVEQIADFGRRYAVLICCRLSEMGLDEAGESGR